MERPQTTSFTRRNLPHWSVDDRPYFVTMRLKGSLPKKVSLQLHDELEQFKATRRRKSAQLEFERKRFVRIESILDKSDPEIAFLASHDIASVVSQSLIWLESELGWTVFASTIMPNHVHLLMQHFDGRNDCLSEDLGRIKSYTANQANKMLGRSGAFWQPENFDHWVRNEEKFLSCVRYILNNPVKAGLVHHALEYHWTSVATEV